IVRKDLSSGPVHSIAFTRTADGSLVATLTLAKGSSYRCVSPAGGQELYVDVHGEAGARSAIAGSSVPGQDRAATTAGTHAMGTNPNEYSPVKVSLIDIPAMAMSQVETESQETAPALASPSEAAQTSGLSAGMALLVSLLVSLVSTATALSAWYVMRRNALKRISRRKVREDAALHAAARPADENETEYRRRSEEEARMLKDLIRTSTQEENPEEEYEQETSLQLARTFKRGSEEIALAQRLHDHGAPALTPERLNTVLSHATTSTQRVQAARKMGVGRGEFDLALKLKSMAEEKKEAHR
ncbi:MAG TPA: hypothetical protein VLT13_11215, partial [Bacteroidota bacterium]|nr:hypothetical protein [Bacteroidota bacterium]